MMTTCECKLCKCDEAMDEVLTIHGVTVGPYCRKCWGSVILCNKCGEPGKYQEDNRKTGVSYYEEHDEYLCKLCRKKTRLTEHICPSCGRNCSHLTSVDGKRICTRCVSRNYFKCETCGKYHPRGDNFFLTQENQLKYQHIFKDNIGGVCNKCAEGFDKSKEAKLHKCENCQSPSVNYYKDKSGKKVYLCNMCVGIVKVCDSCGEIHARSDRITTKKNDKRKTLNVCRTCAKKYVTCGCCGYHHLKSKSTNVQNFRGNTRKNQICPTCIKDLVKCTRCDGLNLSGDVSTINGKPYCGNCSRYVAECKKCKKATEYMNNGSGKCRRCHAIDNETGIIGAYNWKPKFHMHRTGKSKLLFGIENEFSFESESKRDKAIAHIYKNFEENEAYCVHDGSIRPIGFEVVTHPGDFNHVKNVDWAKMFHKNVRKHSTCGMHVHLSKEAFTKFHLFKFVEFIHNNPNFIRIVGQRPESHYCTKNPNKSSKLILEGQSVRYCTINLQNKATVELRFFANVITSDKLLKNIEFLQALFYFTRNNAPKNCTVKNLLQYAGKNKKDFTNFNEFSDRFKLMEVFK